MTLRLILRLFTTALAFSTASARADFTPWHGNVKQAYVILAAWVEPIRKDADTHGLGFVSEQATALREKIIDLYESADCGEARPGAQLHFARLRERIFALKLAVDGAQVPAVAFRFQAMKPNYNNLYRLVKYGSVAAGFDDFELP